VNRSLPRSREGARRPGDGGRVLRLHRGGTRSAALPVALATAQHRQPGAEVPAASTSRVSARARLEVIRSADRDADDQRSSRRSSTMRSRSCRAAAGRQQEVHRRGLLTRAWSPRRWSRCRRGIGRTHRRDLVAVSPDALVARGGAPLSKLTMSRPRAAWGSRTDRAEPAPRKLTVSAIPNGGRLFMSAARRPFHELAPPQGRQRSARPRPRCRPALDLLPEAPHAEHLPARPARPW